MCIRDSNDVVAAWRHYLDHDNRGRGVVLIGHSQGTGMLVPVSYTHLRAHETVLDLVCRLLLEKKKPRELKTLIIYLDTTVHTTSNEYILLHAIIQTINTSVQDTA